MTPEQIAKSNTESAHQKAVFAQAALRLEMFPELRWMHHIPNGGSRSAVTAAKLKGEGVRAGVWDIFLPVPRGGFHGLYVEMKAPGKINNLSTVQKQFRDDLTPLGYAFEVCDHWETAWQAIFIYLNQPKPTTRLWDEK